MNTIVAAASERLISSEMSNVMHIPTDCATSNYQRTIHDPTVWRHLQDVYMDTIEDKEYYQKWETFPSYSGIKVAVEVRDDGPRGRSLYASEFIHEGTQVWEGVHNANFLHPEELQAFLQELDHDLQCDALLWAYAEKGRDYVSLALDPASFLNHGETKEVINLDVDCHALRDIEIGEELLGNYSEFIDFSNHKLDWFTEIRGLAWNDEQQQQQGPQPLRWSSVEDYNLFGAPKISSSNQEILTQQEDSNKGEESPSCDAEPMLN